MYEENIGVMMNKNKISAVGKVFKCAYTLSELVVVMLIIAVIVSVSIKLTKMKLDNITSYTYYAAYSTLRSVTSEMLRNFNAEDEAYGLADVSLNQNIFNKLNRFFTFVGFQPAFGAVNCSQTKTDNGKTYSYVGINKNRNDPAWESFVQECYTYANAKTLQCNGSGLYGCYTEVVNPTSYCNFDQKCTSYETDGSCKCQDCFDYLYIDGRYRCISCLKYACEDICAENEIFVPGSDQCEPRCTGSLMWSDETKGCVDKCPISEMWNDEANACVSKCPDSQTWNDAEGACEDKCTQNEFWSSEKNACVSTPPTVPRTGKTFCESFVGYANTSQLAEDAECKGDAIAGNTTDFNGKKPDFIFRNGMLVYNASQDPKKLDILAGNSKGVTYPASDDSAIDIDEFGYILYVDIDGAKNGDGVLWEDVYPFYVTLSGNVIPAYDENNPETVGGDSKLHLQTSVRDEYIDDTTGRHVEWLTKSKSFKESACLMNMVKEATPYCSRGVAAAGNSNCSENKHDCRLKTVMPVKFF